jgi:microcin C transport system substrate-binding protein|tara:strand:- start:2085 stop:3962 length:1878 start_codon:yes stop_codon:yes gene_type:complete
MNKSSFLFFSLLKKFFQCSIIIYFLILGSLAYGDNHIIKSHGISTFGELKYNSDFQHLDYVNPNAPKGGEVSIWAFGSFDSMHPYTTKGRSGSLSSIFFESLLTGTSDEIGSAYGLVAKSMEYPKDRSWVIFNMRPEAKFSDNTPLTAEDVMFSYKLLQEKGLPSFRAVIEKEIDTVEILGKHKIKFTFKKGIPTRDLPASAGSLPIFSKNYYEKSGADFEASTLTPGIGSGPYILDNLDVGQTINYKRNPEYWGANLPINIGRNNFDKIRVEYFADYNSAFEGFKGGSYTFRTEYMSKLWATGYDFPAIEKKWVTKKLLPSGDMAPGQSFIINLRKDKFKDIRVRKAIGLMFNFEWSNKTLFYDLYARINSFWENSDMAATGKPSKDELIILNSLKNTLPSGIIDSDVAEVSVSSTKQLDRKNLRMASKLLDDAGWEVGDDGLRKNKNGATLDIEILNDSQAFTRIIEPFIENLKSLGVNAVHTKIDNAQMTERERSFDFDIVTGNFPMSFTPGSGLKQYFGSETADVSIFNKAGIKSEVIDELIEVVMAAKTRDELKVAVKTLDRVLRSYYFWIPQWFKDVHTVAYYDYYEHPENLPPYDMGLLDFWWINNEKYNELKNEGAF